MAEIKLYESWRPVELRSTEVVYDADEKMTHFFTAQETKPIVESAKAIAANFDKHVDPKRPIQHVARIPYVIYQRLLLTGIAKDPKAFRQWLNSREGRLMRCDDGRAL
jgi:hypothetical protein